MPDKRYLSIFSALQVALVTSLIFSSGRTLAYETVSASAPAHNVAAWSVASSQTSPSTPEPDPPNLHDGVSMYAPEARLARPAMSNPPTQIELGHYQYWMSCMICHGDRGQGLTDEWRRVLDPADQNCWQSKCHAPNHPPEGFEIPRTSPAVMGEGALTSFKTAAELQSYIRVKMPWAFPGLFDDAEYWRITAYLAQENQIDLPNAPLGPQTGHGLLWISQLPQTHQSPFGYERMVGGAVVLLLIGAAVLQLWNRSST